MKGLTKAVVASFVICIIFTITVVILSCKGVELPEVLIQYFFMTFGTEFACVAGIKITKTIISKTEIENKVKNLGKYNLEIDKDDLKKEDSTEEMYYG